MVGRAKQNETTGNIYNSVATCEISFVRLRITAVTLSKFIIAVSFKSFLLFVLEHAYEMRAFLLSLFRHDNFDHNSEHIIQQEDVNEYF